MRQKFKLAIFFAVLAVLLSITPAQAAYGDAKVIITHIISPWSEVDLCIARPGSPCTVSFISGHDYRIVVQEENLNPVSVLNLTVDRGLTAWTNAGFSHTWMGGPTPSCVQSPNDYRMTCTSTANNQGSLIFNGRATSAADETNASGGVDTLTTQVSTAFFSYSTP